MNARLLFMLSFLLKTRNKNTAQKNPSEPRLIANLRRYFADFPYLRSFPNRPEVSNLGDLLRLLVRSIMKKLFTPFGFQGLIATLPKIIHVRVTKWPFFISNRKKHTNVFFFAFSNWFISGVFTTHRMRVSNKLERKDNFSQSYD